MPKDFRDFQDILTDLDDGRVHEQLTRQLRDVVSSCREAQAAGSLTLTLNVRPDGRQFVVTAKVTPKIPVAKPGLTMFFADDEGALVKADPKQIELRNVTNRAPAPLRTVAEKPE